MYDILIKGGTVVGECDLTPNHYMAISEGKIKYLFSGEKLAARQTIDAGGLYIAPGLIDLHVHGGEGADALDGTTESLERISVFHGLRGTTGILPTIASATPEKMSLALEAASRYTGKERGALILGSHLEGPYLHPSFRGALSVKTFRQPDVKETEEFIAAGRGTLKMMTCAPELPGGLKIVELLSAGGVIPSMGHSGATFEETCNAKRVGLRHITHIFNAMAGMHHREPGPAGAALSLPGISAEVIADGLHVHPCVLKMLWRLKEDELVLVSDAISAAGLQDGSYHFAGQEILVDGGRAALPGGRLAGSTITVLEAVKNMIRLAGLTLPQAVRLASTNPARILGLPQKGRVADGCDAELVLLDANIDPVLVMVGGKIVFRKNL